MASSNPAANSIEYGATIRAWERDLTWWRRLSARLGLQGKLLLCFMVLLAAALGSSCVIFLSQTKLCLREMIGSSAQQLAMALARSTVSSMGQHDHGVEQLAITADNVFQGRNVVQVAFYDSTGKLLAERTRDGMSRAEQLSADELTARTLLRVQPRDSKSVGPFLQVIAPVVDSRRDALNRPPEEASSRLLGFVLVGMSEQYEASQMLRINIMVIAAGCIVAFLSLPMAFFMVHRIFLPIRQLVKATQTITAGDFDARGIAIDRPDQIGDLARSFNDMVIVVKQQQSDVAAANERLAEANRDLEAKIDLRTAQLETANKRLSTEIAEKEDFLRAISHDLNAPLRNISGMATMLLMKNREKFDEDIVHRLERIKSNVDVETDLISELLELSRIKTRRHKMELIDLEQLIWELRGIFENDLKSRGIELIIDTVLPMLSCERARVRQIFQNLIDNAIKYMGDKFDREIHVGCNLRATEAEFYVRDTGMGIDPEDIDKVFFVFRRGKNTVAQAIAGKGVGLASVKSIIETYNGRIWVESKLGEGSTFKFTINGVHVSSLMRSEAQPTAA